jgi:RNA polymerase sigma-70 factor (ECF subfamily)
MHDDEAAVIAAWQRGDEAGVRALFDIWYPRAVKLAVLSGLTPSEAEDCAQEAFLQAFARRRQLRDRRAFPLWFHRIVTRGVLDMLARRHPEREVALAAADALEETWERDRPERPDEAALAAERGAELWRQIERLPSGYRVPLVLRYYGGFSVREVAEMMEVREGTLRVTLHRAIGRLRALARREDVCDAPDAVDAVHAPNSRVTAEARGAT